jgi:hypothetical protein
MDHTDVGRLRQLIRSHQSEPTSSHGETRQIFHRNKLHDFACGLFVGIRVFDVVELNTFGINGQQAAAHTRVGNDNVLLSTFM